MHSMTKLGSDFSVGSIFMVEDYTHWQKLKLVPLITPIDNKDFCVGISLVTLDYPVNLTAREHAVCGCYQIIAIRKHVGIGYTPTDG